MKRLFPSILLGCRAGRPGHRPARRRAVRQARRRHQVPQGGHDGDGSALRPRGRDGQREGAVRRQGRRRQRRDRHDDVQAAVRRLRRRAPTRATPRPSPRSGPRWTSSRAGATKMQDEMVKLNAAAKSGNLDAIKAAAGDVGQGLQGLPRQLPQGVSLRPPGAGRRLRQHPVPSRADPSGGRIACVARSACCALPRHVARARQRPGSPTNCVAGTS